MKYYGQINLWNADQWHYIRLPINWFSFYAYESCGHLTAVITVLGFAFIFDRKN